MHCEVYQRTVRGFCHRNFSENFCYVWLSSSVLNWESAQSLFFSWEGSLQVTGFIKIWNLHLPLGGSTSAVLIAMCTSATPCLKDTTLTSQWFISNKAVADGAISFFIDHFVSARVSKFAYGIEVYQKYNAFDYEHSRRSSATFMSHKGYLGIDGIFSVVLPQVRDGPLFF